MTLKAVFFDLDGTLFDTADDLGNALNNVLQQHGRQPLALQQIRAVVSDGANALLQFGFKLQPEAENFSQLRSELLQNYLQNIATHTRPFPGINELIGNIAQHQRMWGIVTNKPWVYTEALLNKFSFAENPVAVICPDHVTEKKPAPEALILACQQANCHVSEAIYVGDHVRDIECGKRAGVQATISAGYGYIASGEDATRWDADWHVESSEQLWPIIRQYCATPSDKK
ncbi:MAG: HAD-IA family hydrolase [Cellvibrionaceae bacterium]|nr:HAD-IA family hydrolase [Cellvibrionaceae bacterium]